MDIYILGVFQCYWSWVNLFNLQQPSMADVHEYLFSIYKPKSTIAPFNLIGRSKLPVLYICQTAKATVLIDMNIYLC